MKILADALYRPDISLYEPMPEDEYYQEWFGANKEARFHYVSRPVKDTGQE